MPQLNAKQMAMFRNHSHPTGTHLHTAEQIIDPETGEVSGGGGDLEATHGTGPPTDPPDEAGPFIYIDDNNEDQYAFLDYRWVGPLQNTLTDYESTVLATPNVLSYWPMQETSGGFVDDVAPRSFVGTLSGSYTLAVTGPTAQLTNAIRFAGGKWQTNSTVQPSTTEWSWEVWLKTTVNSGSASFVYYRGLDTTNRGWGLYLGQVNGQGVQGHIHAFFDADSTAYGFRGAGTVNDGQWHHVVAAWDGASGQTPSTGQWSFYVDSLLVSTFSAVSTGVGNAPYTGIGIEVGRLTSIDLAALSCYNRALTAQEVEDHFVASQ